MARIVECVPNFSEGQQKEVIEAIASAIASTDGCNILDVDPGLSTNRTVYTFVGSPEAVVEGALCGARAAAQLIDMTRHRGEHPRLGALDVCPFIPIKGVSMEDCVQCAKEFGERLATELGVPVYLYGEAATQEHRKTVPQIRAGEYEGLTEKLPKPEWKPDFGLPEFVPTWGATLTGARNFLIAYNINILGTKEQAHRIALNIREQGRSKEEPGTLKHTQAIGWYLEEANMAQVSVNITNHDEMPMHVVYEEVVKEAKELQLGVCGSQVVGLLPLRAIMDAADHYMKQENLFLLEEDQKIRLVVDRLGLHSLGGFSPKERIIEYMIQEDREGPLVTMSVREFVMTVGARSPSPGGGSVAALTATLGASLGTMVGFLTYGNKKFHHLDAQIRKLLPPLYQAMKDLMPLIDADAASFSEYMMTCKLPHSDEEETAFREEAMQQAIRLAVSVPMNVAVISNQLWPTLIELAKIVNISCKSDLQVGVKSLETAVYGAKSNVLINLDNVKDESVRAKMKEDAEAEMKKAEEGCAEVLKILDSRQD